MTTRASTITHLPVDAVVFLTESDLFSEPVSNRHHWLTRWSKALPVFFFQNSRGKSRPLSRPPILDLNPPGFPVSDVFVADCGRPLSQKHAAKIAALLRQKGIKKPLFWVYDAVNYRTLVAQFPTSFVVLHATENYFDRGANLDVLFNQPERLQEQISEFFPFVDLLVAVSTSVLAGYRKAGYLGQATIIRNGCDAEFWTETVDVITKPKSAVFQGGINARLDFELLSELSKLLPDWTFTFVGGVAADSGWERLERQPNVINGGKLGLSELRSAVQSSEVGLIPFRDMSALTGSFPLKTFEYVAAGLPVVSTPIDDLSTLAKEENILRFAQTPQEFADALKQLRFSRYDPRILKRRAELAFDNSYDGKFAEAQDLISRIILEKKRDRSARVAVLYDSASLHVNSISDHLKSFGKFSRHVIDYLPATTAASRVLGNSWPSIDFSAYNAIVIHFSVRVCFPGHLDSNYEEAIRNFDGPKILFVQDDYDNTSETIHFLKRVGITTLYTIVPEAGLGIIYPGELVGPLQVISTLTGFAPSVPASLQNKLMDSSRSIDVGYRGRVPSRDRGELGLLKAELGGKFAGFARGSGLVCDVSSRDEDRLYGVAWLEFLANCKAVLGSPSASNTWPDAPWIEGNTGADGDAGFSMEQVSPRIFEAVATRTALVLLEGNYSGVVEAGEHFFPLKRDFSNFDDVLDFLNDSEALEGQVNRAHKHLIGDYRYSYEHFIAGVDDHISSCVDGLFSLPQIATYSEVTWIRSKERATGSSFRVMDLDKPMTGPPTNFERSAIRFFVGAPFRVLKSLARRMKNALLTKLSTTSRKP